jgi:hypothetical protein
VESELERVAFSSAPWRGGSSSSVVQHSSYLGAGTEHTQDVVGVVKDRRSSFFLKFPENSPKSWFVRWYIFKPKIPIWVNFGGSCDGRCWYILWPLVYFTVSSVYFGVIWYM